MASSVSSSYKRGGYGGVSGDLESVQHVAKKLRQEGGGQSPSFSASIQNIQIVVNKAIRDVRHLESENKKLVKENAELQQRLKKRDWDSEIEKWDLRRGEGDISVLLQKVHKGEAKLEIATCSLIDIKETYREKGYSLIGFDVCNYPGGGEDLAPTFDLWYHFRFDQGERDELIVIQRPSSASHATFQQKLLGQSGIYVDKAEHLQLNMESIKRFFKSLIPFPVYVFIGHRPLVLDAFAEALHPLAIHGRAGKERRRACKEALTEWQDLMTYSNGFAKVSYLKIPVKEKETGILVFDSFNMPYGSLADKALDCLFDFVPEGQKLNLALVGVKTTADKFMQSKKGQREARDLLKLPNLLEYPADMAPSLKRPLFYDPQSTRIKNVVEKHEAKVQVFEWRHRVSSTSLDQKSEYSTKVIKKVKKMLADLHKAEPFDALPMLRDHG